MILFKVSKSLKTRFYITILLFSLIISLQVKNNKKLALNAKKITVRRLEL